jgi:thiosulfate/3-mercaptopyruvate sulfurtransferase
MSSPALPLIVQPEQLEARREDPVLLIVDLSDQPTYAMHHVPGAIHLAYGHIVAPRPPAMGLLPDDQRLGEVLSAVGVSPDTHVVAYDDEGNGRACRLLWTLDVIGHRGFSLLNGGLQAWVNEGHATEEGVNALRRGDFKVSRHTEASADKAYVLAHLDDPGVVILDTRTRDEFAGIDRRAARGGHIPGAVNMDWREAMDRANNLRLKPERELRQLFEALGVTSDKEIITHCQTHHRSAHTYITLKSLGYPSIKGYAGSWSEWGNDPELPVAT